MTPLNLRFLARGLGLLILVNSLVLFGAGAVRATDVTFRLEDQNAVEIPGSTFYVTPGGITVPTGGMISLAAGGYSVTLRPGMNGNTQSWDQLTRTESLNVSETTQIATFEWKTGGFTVNTIRDQHGSDISGSKWSAYTNWAPPRSLPGQTFVLPVTEDPDHTAPVGTFGVGYTITIYPGLGGIPQPATQSLLHRNDANLELTAEGATYDFEWKTGGFTVNTIRDQHGSDISGSKWSAYTNWAPPRSLPGQTFVLPVTEDPDHTAPVGTFGVGYTITIYPGLGGIPQPATQSLLHRNDANLELTAEGATYDFEWKTGGFTVNTIRDQHGSDISGSKWSAYTNWAPPRSLPGQTFVLPVTEDPDHTAPVGTFGVGYTITIYPGLGGIPQPATQSLLHRNDANLELTAEGATYDFEWKTGAGTLHVVDGSESEVDGSSVSISSVRTFVTGDPATLPVTEEPGVPITGSYAGGYPFTFISPAGGTFTFELHPGGVFSPTFVNIGGSNYGLRFNLGPSVVSVSGNVGNSASSSCTGPLANATVDLHVGEDYLTTFTDGVGDYSFTDVPAGGSAEISIVVPLGFAQYLPEEVDEAIVLDDDRVVDFSLLCLPSTGEARSKGYWKHQASVYVKNKGSAQEDSASMTTTFPDRLFNHFHNNQMASIVVDGITHTGGTPVSLETILETLKKKGSMQDKAKQQYMALLLNMASGKVLSLQVVSDDGGTASQAIQQVAAEINATNGDHELAKDIAETLNHGELVATGVIDLDLPNIAYARPRVVDVPLRVSPNPGGAQVYTFSFGMPQAGRATLEIFNVAGRRIATPFSSALETGRREITWNGRTASGSRLGHGVYFARLTTSKGSKAVKFAHLGR